jgi:hypothetical protein
LGGQEELSLPPERGELPADGAPHNVPRRAPLTHSVETFPSHNGSAPTVSPMHRRSLPARVCGVITAAALAVSLVACVDTTRIPPAPTETEGASPLFASDEEALAAAVEAYERFLAVSAQILQEGGENPERLRPLVSDAVFDSELEGFRATAEAGYRLVGASEIVSADLQQRIPLEGGDSETTVSYFCVSSANADVVDESGDSVVTGDAPLTNRFEVAVLHGANGALIESKLLWVGDRTCE